MVFVFARLHQVQLKFDFSEKCMCSYIIHSDWPSNPYCNIYFQTVIIYTTSMCNQASIDVDFSLFATKFMLLFLQNFFKSLNLKKLFCCRTLLRVSCLSLPFQQQIYRTHFIQWKYPPLHSTNSFFEYYLQCLY